MRAILIDPFEVRLDEIEIDADSITLRSIFVALSHPSRRVDCFAPFSSRYLKFGDVVFADDEAGRIIKAWPSRPIFRRKRTRRTLVRPCDRYFSLSGFTPLVAGKGLMLGIDPASDDIAAARTSLKTCRAIVMFYAATDDGRALPTRLPWKPRGVESR
jgi:hypothetical protein